MFEAREIHVALGGTTILDGVSLAARPGQMTAIVGPNGSGKTTLVRAMTGEVRCRGTVTVQGRDIRRTPAAELAGLRAVMAQKVALAFPFTALEVVRIGQSFGLDPDPALPTRALARVGLLPLADRPYQLLSGGEQARVQLARALVQVWQPVRGGVPRWLVLDEPVASLDIGHQLQVMRIARDFADAGGGVVAVMHDLNLTAMFADRVVLMLGGRVLAQGTPAEVLTDAHLSRAYGCRVAVNAVPSGRAPFVLPQRVAVAAGDLDATGP